LLNDEIRSPAASQQAILGKKAFAAENMREVLQSPRSDAFVSGFLDSWLNLRNLGGMPPDRNEFEEYYSQGLEQAFKTETRMFMRDLIEHDASLVNFLDSDYSFFNQALSMHYELGDLGGPARTHECRKVSFKNNKRGGLLGMGSVLTITANGIDTSPVTRCVFDDHRFCRSHGTIAAYGQVLAPDRECTRRDGARIRHDGMCRTAGKSIGHRPPYGAHGSLQIHALYRRRGSLLRSAR
jgi:hypothetical protein